jgi:hypothetical protein
MALEDVTAAASDLVALREAVGDALGRRDRAIKQAFADGVPIGAIASAATLTRARVSSILGHPFERVGRPPRSTPSAT